MLTTKRKPATVGEILVEEFMQPMGLTQAALAEAMGVQRKHVSELCNNRRNVTAATALILARIFGNSPDFWLNVTAAQRSVGGDEQPSAARANRTRKANWARRHELTERVIALPRPGRPIRHDVETSSDATIGRSTCIGLALGRFAWRETPRT